MTKLSYDNIFDSITDPEEAAELQFRADLLSSLIGMFENKGWGQDDIRKALDEPHSRVSELTRGKLAKLSSRRLIGYLRKMGYRLHPKLDGDDLVCSVEAAPIA